MRPLTRSEIILAGICSLLLLLAVACPPLAYPHDHAFVDQRAWLGIPNAADVLSNLGFALAGAVGLFALWRTPARSIDNVERGMGALFFVGLLFTAAASSWYHLHPDATGLAVDRTGMAVAFAGLLGLATAGRITPRAGAWLGLALLALAPAAIRQATEGNVLPWAVIQFGGIGLLLWLAAVRQRPLALDVRWGWVLVAYGIAKVAEMHDDAIFSLTDGWIAGHAIKHLVAALAAWPVIASLARARQERQMGRTRTRGQTAGNAGRA